MARTNEFENGPINTITEGTEIKGDIKAAGDFRFDGKLEGNFTLNGKLVVGENGHVNGNIVCQNATIMGHVVGNITVKDQLSLNAAANVKGDILINKLAIEPGASFSGTCRMIDEVRRENRAAEELMPAEN